MQRTKFYIQILEVMFAFLASCDLQAKIWGKSCEKQEDCDKGLICTLVSRTDNRKLCKYGKDEVCNYDTDCAFNLLCKHKKKDKYYCTPGCLSDSNCSLDMKCIGKPPVNRCSDSFGRCHTKNEIGKDGARCYLDSDCNKGLVCKTDNMYGFHDGYRRAGGCETSGTCIYGRKCKIETLSTYTICKKGYKCDKDTYPIGIDFYKCKKEK